jgi:hypothetical protein
MIGFYAISLTSYFFKVPGPETPIKTSIPLIIYDTFPFNLSGFVILESSYFYEFIF